MKLLIKIIAVLFLSVSVYSHAVFTDPEFPTEYDSITVFLDATQPGVTELLNYAGTLYAHTGVNTNNGNWQHVIGDWGNNTNQPALERLGANFYKLTIGFPRQFYSVVDPSEHINQIAIVFRSADGSLQSRPDIFLNIYKTGLNLFVENPEVSVDFGDPQRSPAFVKQGTSVLIKLKTIEIGTKVSSLNLFIDGNLVTQSNVDSLEYLFSYNNYSPGPHDVLAVGVDTSGNSDSTIFMMFVNPPIINSPPPAGVEPGITINDPTNVTFLLFAPDKDFVYLLGDFNDWKVETDYFLNRWAEGADDVVWWITLNNISPGIEYAFQYFVDGEIRPGDPYGHKILDPWNDHGISTNTYPNLKPYPVGKTDYLVTTFQTGQSPYPWQITNFEKPPKEELVIYELLIRDFLDSHDYKTLTDTLNYLKLLGVNAIELMPVMEFSGNNSWGYNPTYHLALDKYYGPPNDFKSFIDSAHANGIAVILDMVLNHIEFESAIAQLYWDWDNNRPAANNPWLNQAATHPFSVFNDFNHESEPTKYYVDRVNKYWIEEYMIDGYRFDLSKGFTQFNSGGNVSLWGQYDQSRIDILTRMADTIWTSFPDAYVILEHFAENSEETVLSDYGMMLWGNMNHAYNEATMGYSSNLSGATHISRGWNDLHLVSYMESHDEERLMYKNLQFGNSSGNYDIKDFPIAIQRIKLAAAFYLTIPGPKMIWQFGELGYDFSINYPCMTNDCRTDPKPIRWDYYDDGNRRNLYKVFQALIDLRNFEAFKSTNYNYALNTMGKRLTILDPSMNMNIVGNFNVQSLSINPVFPNTGWWYDYFSGDSILVSNVNDLISLQPGEFHIYSTVKLPTPEDGILSDVEHLKDITVEEYNLDQNYPNPFNPSTTIRFSIVVPGNVSIKIYDVLGREVKNLINEVKTAGTYSSIWNGNDNFGNKVNSGVYFYKLRAGDFVETKKMILLK
jgi:glycosidase